MVLVVSEPITATATDWVAIPPNTALVITREKNGFVNVMRTPLAAGGKHPRQGGGRQVRQRRVVF